MMLRHGLGRDAEAEAVESAVEAALGRGLRTPDLAPDESAPPPMSDLPSQVVVGTEEMTAAVLEALGG
jgi:isocitrate/isopropylmalate dehydrogenase